MAEHGGRYTHLAEALNGAGYVVYGHDHRGHGKTAKVEGDLGYFADTKGWSVVVEDVLRVNREIHDREPGLQVFLVGHSMGSMVCQSYLFEHADTVAGCALSGSPAGARFLAKVGALVARVERMRLGKRGRSKLLEQMSSSDFNKRFEPARTRFDYLSRDAAQVDLYVEDPHCGFDFTVQGWMNVLRGVNRNLDPDNHRRLPRDLPICFLSGSDDPVGGFTKGPRELIEAYGRAGLTRVTHHFYEGARHEIFNETNREEVERDLIAWLDATLDLVRG